MLKHTHPYMSTGKTIALTIQTFVSKVMSLLFNMLPRFVIAYSRSKRLLISWLQSPSVVILQPKNIKSVTVSPSICHEVMGPDPMILVFLKVEFYFKPVFLLSSFTFIKRLFSSSSLSAIRMVSSVYMRLLVFLLAIVIPACASSSPAFLMMYSAYKLNKQGDNIQPSVQFSSVAQSCPTLCNPMNRSTPGLPVHHQLLEFTQTHVHRVGDAIQPSHPLSSPSPPAPNPSQHQNLFQ